MPNLPPSLYGPNHDGLLDPDRPTSRERRNSRSPVMSALQRAADRALGRGKS